MKKTAQTDKNILIETLVPVYLEATLESIDSEKVRSALKGRFKKLRYTLGGFDVSDLSYNEKIELIIILFSLNSEASGVVPATAKLEQVTLAVNNRIGPIRDFPLAVLDFPEGVFKYEKLKALSEDQLRKKAAEILRKLEEMQEETRKTVAAQTMKLEAERNMLEAVLYNATDGVFTLDLNKNIITFNKVMEALTGYSFDEVVGRPADDVVRLFESSQPISSDNYCIPIVSEAEPNVFTREKLTLVARNGEKKYVSMNSTALPEGRQISLGCVVTLSDITKEIELENMKLDFVSIAAHELRTPLTSIRGYLALLEDELGGKLSEEHRGYLRRSIISTNQLHILVENLLNVSRIERGSLVLDKKKVVWQSLVKLVIERFEESAENAGVGLKFVESKTRLPEVYVDETTISEVVSNLLDNAIRYTPGGGRVSVFFEVVGDKVLTHIKDTGVGIPTAAIPHLFKKFYRVSTVLKEGEKGTGLGLFISKEIVRLHGGNIWVESEEGKGSTFTFSIPVYNPNAERQP